MEINWSEPSGRITLEPNEFWERRKNGMNRVKCEYCGQTNDGDTQLHCNGCGAGLPELEKLIFDCNYNPYYGVLSTSVSVAMTTTGASDVDWTRR